MEFTWYPGAHGNSAKYFSNVPDSRETATQTRNSGSTEFTGSTTSILSMESPISVPTETSTTALPTRASLRLSPTDDPPGLFVTLISEPICIQKLKDTIIEHIGDIPNSRETITVTREIGCMTATSTGVMPQQSLTFDDQPLGFLDTSPKTSTQVSTSLPTKTNSLSSSLGLGVAPFISFPATNFLFPTHVVDGTTSEISSSSKRLVVGITYLGLAPSSTARTTSHQSSSSTTNISTGSKTAGSTSLVTTSRMNSENGNNSSSTGGLTSHPRPNLSIIIPIVILIAIIYAITFVFVIRAVKKRRARKMLIEVTPFSDEDNALVKHGQLPAGWDPGLDLRRHLE